MSLRGQFIAFDDALARHGVPPLTAWFRDGIGTWLDGYEAGGALELYACVGRGSSKSTSLYKLSTFFTLFGSFHVPPGERHFAVVLSRLKEEASKGVGIISRWLTLLGVGHRVTAEVIELTDLPRGIRIVAASVAATSGWRAYLVARDERSKWRSGSAEEEQDAEEIDTSATAMTATHARAPQIYAGSAWGAAGGFYDAVMAGSTSSRRVLGPVATWIAAPHITAESLRRKEPNPARFAREYECVFQAGGFGAFELASVEACVRRLNRETRPLSGPTLVIDSSAGRGDAWTFGLAAWSLEPSNESEMLMLNVLDASGAVSASGVVPARDSDGRPIRNPKFEDPKKRLRVFDLGAFEGKFGASLSSDEVVSRIAQVANRFGARRVYGDQYLAYALQSAFAKHRLTFESKAWDNAAKVDAMGRLRQWLREGTLVVEPGDEADKLKKEMLAFEERITPSGAITYAARRAAHDDRVALLLLLARLDVEGELVGSPIHQFKGRIVRTGFRYGTGG